jgi:hypothetical protein
LTVLTARNRVRGGERCAGIGDRARAVAERLFGDRRR